MKPALAFMLGAALLAVIGLAGYRYRQAIGWGDGARAEADPPPAYTITFVREACLGECPNFLLKIDPAGKVELHIPRSDTTPSADPRSGITISGAPLSPARYAALIKRFEKGGFRELKRNYSVDVTDGPTTKIALDSTRGLWSTQVYMVPCVNEVGPLNMKTLLDWGVTEFVPKVFCDLSSELDRIACDTYLSKKSLNETDSVNSFRPSHCKRP